MIEKREIPSQVLTEREEGDEDIFFRLFTELVADVKITELLRNESTRRVLQNILVESDIMIPIFQEKEGHNDCESMKTWFFIPGANQKNTEKKTTKHLFSIKSKSSILPIRFFGDLVQMISSKLQDHQDHQNMKFFSDTVHFNLSPEVTIWMSEKSWSEISFEFEGEVDNLEVCKKLFDLISHIDLSDCWVYKGKHWLKDILELQEKRKKEQRAKEDLATRQTEVQTARNVFESSQEKKLSTDESLTQNRNEDENARKSLSIRQAEESKREERLKDKKEAEQEAKIKVKEAKIKVKEAKIKVTEAIEVWSKVSREEERKSEKLKKEKIEANRRWNSIFICGLCVVAVFYLAGKSSVTINNQISNSPTGGGIGISNNLQPGQ